MTTVARTVFLLDGPIGVGKTTLGKSVAAQLDLCFLDRDDHAEPGLWPGSVRRTGHRILAASIAALEDRPGVLIAGPVRCVEWLFYVGNFQRIGVACHCIGLVADSAHIEARARVLDPDERCRSREMLLQGYGRRPFNRATLRTDRGDLAQTSARCCAILSELSHLPELSQCRWQKTRS